MITWDLCAEGNQGLGVDVSHWQGTKLDWAKMFDLGLEWAVAKAWHGTGALSTDDVQLEAARRNKFLTGKYAWLLPKNSILDQIASYEIPANDCLPLTLDWEEPDVPFKGKRLVALLEEAIERTADKTGRLPIIYTGEWYWADHCADVDSELVASCPLWFAAYPRLANATGVRYRDAANEACGGTAPRIPRPWRERGLTPTLWQFDGDKGLVLPTGVLPTGDSATGGDVDVNMASRARIARLVPSLAPKITPTLEAERPYEFMSREELLDLLVAA